jgi:hypothetical protein
VQTSPGLLPAWLGDPGNTKANFSQVGCTFSLTFAEFKALSKNNKPHARYTISYIVLSMNDIIRMQIKDKVATVCPECNSKVLCIKKETEGTLSAFCIDGLLTLCFEKT